MAGLEPPTLDTRIIPQDNGVLPESINIKGRYEKVKYFSTKVVHLLAVRDFSSKGQIGIIDDGGAFILVLPFFTFTFLMKEQLGRVGTNRKDLAIFDKNFGHTVEI